MATGRKGPSVPPTRKRAADGDEGEATGAPPDDLVAVVRGLAAAVADHGLSELIVDTPDVTFTLRRGALGTVTSVQQVPMQTGPIPTMPSMQIPTMPMSQMSMPSITIPPPTGPAASGAITLPATNGAAAPEEKVHVVTSPFVGTFYRRPNPDAPEYVKVNDKVNKGAVLCIVEAMKLMNEIEADVAGTIVGVLAEDGAPVEYGQPLFKIA